MRNDKFLSILCVFIIINRITSKMSHGKHPFQKNRVEKWIVSHCLKYYDGFCSLQQCYSALHYFTLMESYEKTKKVTIIEMYCAILVNYDLVCVCAFPGELQVILLHISFQSSKKSKKERPVTQKTTKEMIKTESTLMKLDIRHAF